MPCLAICAFHRKISLLFKKKVNKFSRKVFLGGRRMIEIPGCYFTLKTQEFLVTVIITWWIYLLILDFQRCIWSWKYYLLERDSVSFSFSCFFPHEWLKIHYESGLLLGENFLSPHCEAIDVSSCNIFHC